MSHKVGTLKTGDYSIEGFEDKITVEVKALGDFIGCCTHDRERFERELVRMRSFQYKAIVIKSTWAAIELKQYRGSTHPNAILGSAMAFAMSANVPIIMAGDFGTASKLVARLLYISGNRCIKSLSSSTNSVIMETANSDEEPSLCLEPNETKKSLK
jgi:ERCC4-type nuclease